MGVRIVNGLLSRDHVHMFFEIAPKIAVSAFVQRAKGHAVSSTSANISAKATGLALLGPGYCCATSGNITDDLIMRYLAHHTKHSKMASASTHEPTGASR